MVIQQEEIKDAINKLIELYQSNDWKYDSSKNGVEIKVHESKVSIGFVKGEKEFKCSVNEFISQHENFDKRRKWDDAIEDIQLIQNIENNGQLYHVYYESPAMFVSKRDFIQIRYHDWRQINNKNCLVMAYFSTEQQNEPECSGYVRGTLLKGSGWILEPTDQEIDPREHTDKNLLFQVTYMVGLDPAGNIPTFVVNQTKTSQALRINDLESQFS